MEQTEIFAMNMVTLLILLGCALKCLTGFLLVTTSVNYFYIKILNSKFMLKSFLQIFSSSSAKYIKYWRPWHQNGIVSLTRHCCKFNTHFRRFTLSKWYNIQGIWRNESYRLVLVPSQDYGLSSRFFVIPRNIGAIIKPFQSWVNIFQNEIKIIIYFNHFYM